MTVDVENPQFWINRIYEVLAQDRPIHQVIYDESIAVWNRVQEETIRHLKFYVKRGASVLDAGCGYGALIECFDEARIEVDYLGIDLSPDLIRLADARYLRSPRPGRRFLQADLRAIPLNDSSVDIVVSRSVEGVIKGNVGYDVFDRMLKEMRRVCRDKVLLLEYPTDPMGLMKCEVIHK